LTFVALLQTAALALPPKHELLIAKAAPSYLAELYKLATW